jgi:hypothetical protein
MFLDLFIFIYRNDEGTSFMTFIQKSLYPKGNNVSKDKCHYPLIIVLPCSWCIAFESKRPIDYFISFGQRDTTISPVPHNGNIVEVPSLHCNNLTLFDG